MKRWMTFLIALAAALMIWSMTAGADEKGSLRADHFTGGAMGMNMIELTVDEEADFISVWPVDTVTDVHLELVRWWNDEIVDVQELYRADTLTSKDVMNVRIFLPDVLPILRVRLENGAGEKECWYIGDSGEDGSILLLEPDDTWLPAGGTTLLERMAGIDFYFSSGVGGWFTHVVFAPDGTFNGDFHDSEMGDSGEGYPLGSVFGCDFHGRVEAPERVDDNTWALSLTELAQDEDTQDEVIIDGIRYVAAPPYGLTGTDRLLVYLPGTPVEALPEAYLMWSHLNLMEETPASLPFYGLYNEAEECGFVGERNLQQEN